MSEVTISDAIAELRKRRDATEQSQLATYVGNLTLDQFTDEERGRPVQPGDDSSCAGWDFASQLSLERLRELFLADDYGPAWELFDGEQTEYYENDEGAIRTYEEAIRLLSGEGAT